MEATRMKHSTMARTAAALALAWIPVAQAAVYPARGQSDAQQQKDAHACYKWASKQSGFDPVQAGVVNEPPPQTHHAVGKGAALGTVGGLLFGAPLAGAAIGAGAGAIHKRNRQKQAENAQSAQRQAQVDSYERAESACLEGRGYTVK
jgi:hypothetical protein